MSEHFSIAEMVASDTARLNGIDNTAPAEVLPALEFTTQGLERIRHAVGGKPIKILSGYRCPALNTEVGGSKNSQHMKGEAADIVCPSFGTVHQLAKFIESNIKALDVDQVIKERNKHGAEWVHVSFSATPRHMALTIYGNHTTTGIV